MLLALVAGNLIVWAALLISPGQKLKVSFLDVGQGDAILIETPSKRQILIDGGKNRQVLARLGESLPFGDRDIDVIIATHPDADHIGGLPEVVSRYEVSLFLEPGVESDNSVDDELHSRLDKRGVQTLLARRGQVLDFGDGAKLAILFPDRDVFTWDTNDASIVAKLVYGNESFLFTGDSTIRAENILMSLDAGVLDSDVLKAGHHGSRTSTSLSYAEAVSPAYAVISAGKDNSYGHPHKEVLNILQKIGSQIVSTIDSGTIKFVTDGQSLRLK